MSAELCDSSTWSVRCSANADANFVTDCAVVVVGLVVIAFVLFAIFA